MSTGVEKLDEQHRALFNKFNELEKNLSSGSWREVGKILDFIQFYTDWHFGLEEQEMEKRHCPAALENQRQHAEFRVKFGKFYSEWQNGSFTYELAQQLNAELENWLIEHVIKVDSHLRFE
jgi:hemerythrin